MNLDFLDKTRHRIASWKCALFAHIRDYSEIIRIQLDITIFFLKLWNSDVRKMCLTTTECDKNATIWYIWMAPYHLKWYLLTRKKYLADFRIPLRISSC